MFGRGDYPLSTTQHSAPALRAKSLQQNSDIRYRALPSLGIG